MSGPYSHQGEPQSARHDDAGRDAARAFADGLAGAQPRLSNMAGELWTVGSGRIARSLNGTPWMQRLRSWACHRTLKVAMWLGFPFGGLVISHHSPQAHDGDGATSIDLTWRGQRYTGFLVDEDPRK